MAKEINLMGGENYDPPTWKLEKRKLSKLKDYPHNPRTLNKHQYQGLKNNIDRFGFIEKPCVTPNGIIIGGHQRTRVLKDQGVKELEVWVPDRELSEKEIKHLNMTLNRSGGEFDPDMVANNYTPDELLETGWTPEQMGGFSPVEVEEIESQDGEDDVPEPPKEPKTKKGDLYEIGDHRLLCGDCIMFDEFNKVLGEELIDLVVTDPPYNVDYGAKNERLNKVDNGNRIQSDIKNDKMSDDDFKKFLYDAYTNLYASMKNGSPIYVFYSDSESINFHQAFKESGFKLSEVLIWVKHHFILGQKDYHYKHEPILYGWKEGEAHKWYSDRKQTTVFEFDKPMSSKHHPTMKPIDMLVYLIQNSSQKEDIVWDSFLGSGSTLIACEKLNRRCMGLELEPKYCDVIVSRWQEFRKKSSQDATVKRNGEVIDW